MTSTRALRQTTARTAALAGLALLALVTAGCSGGDPGGEVARGSGSITSEEGGGDSVAFSGARAGDEDAPEPMASTAPDGTAAKEIIYEGSMSLTAADPLAAADAAAAAVAARGGHVEARQQRAAGEGSSAWAEMTVRVPAASLEAAITDLRAIATVHDISQTSTDVTAEGADLDARITALQKSVDRLYELMAKADRTEDLLTIERSITERQAQLDGLTAQRTVLSGQVALATFQLSFTTPADAPSVSSSNFLTGLENGWEALVSTVSAALVVLGTLLPWAVVVAVVLAIVLPVVRRRRRRTAAPVTAPEARP